MSTITLQELDHMRQAEGPAAAIAKLIEALREQRDYHKLFDALLLRKKFELGLPLVRPTSFDDIPDDRRDAFEKCYIDSAREVGHCFLAENKLTQAWIYFRTIREPEPVAHALETVSARREASEETQELINLALFEGANPVKGLELLLRSHGTCNTITTLDQQLPQLSPEDRSRAAALLVRELYHDLCQSIRYHVEQRLALVPPAESLRAWIAGRDWLFEGGNYHIDVSHLSSVVRFARSLNASSPELKLAVELAEYGSHLDRQFQYPGDPPFDDYYPAHVHFLTALSGSGQDEALSYFRRKLADEPDERDKQMIAYVLVDLLLRIDRLADAVAVAEQHLKDLDESTGFSFAGLCQKAGRMDTLKKVAGDRGDWVGFLAAAIQESGNA
jgi:hypothetical protein